MCTEGRHVVLASLPAIMDVVTRFIHMHPREDTFCFLSDLFSSPKADRLLPFFPLKSILKVNLWRKILVRVLLVVVPRTLKLFSAFASFALSLRVGYFQRLLLLHEGICRYTFGVVHLSCMCTPPFPLVCSTTTTTWAIARQMLLIHGRVVVSRAKP